MSCECDLTTYRLNGAFVLRRILAVVALLCAALIGGGGPTQADAAGATVLRLPAGLGLHDGMIADFRGTYYVYGTVYSNSSGCHFQWNARNTPWCGLGVATASSLSGPWSAPTLLFDPDSKDPWTGQSWQVECGSTGQGCFNARMIQRTGWGANDGVFILWFNSPIDYSRNHSNAYNAMGCTGPAGPCGPGAPGHGSYTKPSLRISSGNGDFGIIGSGTPGQAPAMICSMPGAASLSIEQLDYWGNGGTGAGSTKLAGLSSIEGDGGYYDPASSTYVITYSDPDCGYCSGTATGYATSGSLLGPYTAPVNVAAAAPPPAGGRRDISATSCGGQPRTISVVDGQAWQGIDLWTGHGNEASAGVLYEPLHYTGAPTNVPGDGQPWTPPFTPWTC